MPSLCSECLFCRCAGGCLAGNGDDDFSPLNITEIQTMIDTKFHQRWGRNLSDKELIKLENIMKNGYTRTSYFAKEEKIY